MQIYLAGPFFNKESKSVLRQILNELEELGHEVWAPMRDGIECPKDADAAMRRKVFQLDCEQLHWAECVVALLDYPMPPHQYLRLHSRTPEGKIDLIDISFPDSGTVFEIGYTVGLNEAGSDRYRCIIGYTKTSGFNLMVAEACDCIVSDTAQLQQAMKLVDEGNIEALAFQYATGDLREL